MSKENLTPDTGPVKLPALAFAPTGNAAMDEALSLVKEHLELRNGARGNPWERAVTVREIQGMQAAFASMQQPKEAKDNEIIVNIGNGWSASIAIDRFIESIKSTKLYKDLLKSLDDPTRFDDLPAEIRDIVSKSVADAALEMGTQITQTKKLIQDSHRKLALQVDELFAAQDQNAAGIRETRWVVAETDFAQAGYIKQLQASLGKYYQDGSPGRASLEQQMTVTADRVTGLNAQYTLKVQAGGALAGYGIAATEANGVPSSAFIIMADKFAIVSPTYSGGMTTTPAFASIPFGVDANGIYMNTSVYIRGSMRVDTGGKTLIQGLRGSVNIGISGAVWSDTAARNAVWQQLGNGGSAPNNNHLVIGDQVMISNSTVFSEARMWAGSSWVIPGVVINGSMVVNGSLAASKIDTRGLTIRDDYGNVIFGAGAGLDVSRITGLGTLATRNNVDVAQGQVAGLGALATQNNVFFGSTVKLPDGSTANVADFVNRLNRISSGNINAFIDGLAITRAYIGNAAIGSAQIENLAVDTLKIAGDAITVPGSGWAPPGTMVTSSSGPSVTIYMGDLPNNPARKVYVVCNIEFGGGTTHTNDWSQGSVLIRAYLRCNQTGEQSQPVSAISGSLPQEDSSGGDGGPGVIYRTAGTAVVTGVFTVYNGYNTFTLLSASATLWGNTFPTSFSVDQATLLAIGTKR